MIGISRRTHGFIDYSLGFLLLLAPYILRFQDEPTRGIAFIFGVFIVFYSAVTDYELALLRFLPFPFHRFLDMLWGFLLALAPIHFSVGGAAAVLFVILGLAAMVAGFATPGSFSDSGSDHPIFPWMRK